MSRRRWLQGLGVAGAVGLAGCADGQGGTDSPTGTDTDQNAVGAATESPTPRNELPEVGGTYRVARSVSAETLNPLYNNSAGAGGIIARALDWGGYYFKPGTRVVPLHYESIEPGPDAKVWTITLRDNLRFSEPYGQVTAEDYVYQIKNLHQTDWAATADSSSWPNEVTVEQTGELEFQVTLPSSNALYPETYDPLLTPIPKDLVKPYVEEKDLEGLQQNEELLELQFTGNLGPYTMKEWKRSDKVVLERNDDYYLKEHAGSEGVPQIFAEAPYFEAYESQVVKEQSSRLGALKKGEIDSAGVPPNRVAEFEGMDSIDVKVQPTPYNQVLTYNFRDNGWSGGEGNLFRNKEFRQAFACAVDKQKLLKGVFRDYGQVEQTWQPTWSKWYPEDESVIPQYGVGELYGKEATQSRMESAISDTDYSLENGRLINPSGEQVELSLYYSSGQPTEKSNAEFLKQELETNAGIKVRLEAIAGAQFARKYWQQEVPDNPDEYEWSNGPYNAGPWEVTSANGWDMQIVYGLNTYPLNPTTASVFFEKDSYYNPYGYQPEWNAKELFNEAKAATSEEELKDIFEEIFVKIAEHQPMGMLLFSSDTPGYSSDLVGPVENFHSGWNIGAWYREE